MSTPRMQWGTQLREVAVVLGRRVETISYVVDVESPQRWTFADVSGPLPVSGSYDLVSKSANGTQFTYRISVGLPGMWALAAPLLRRSGGHMLRTGLDRLRRNLESPQRHARQRNGLARTQQGVTTSTRSHHRRSSRS